LLHDTFHHIERAKPAKPEKQGFPTDTDTDTGAAGNDQEEIQCNQRNRQKLRSSCLSTTEAGA
jgi:hypothetical protein